MRKVDYYALVLAERVCVAGAGDAPMRNITVIRLDMPAEAAQRAVQKRVLVQGALSADPDPEADAPLVMKVTGLAEAK